MIFACDLDQTLIYSRNSMGPIEQPDELVPVELDQGEYRSFMTRTAYRDLQALSGRVHFVPTTTRIYEQYRRIFGLTEGVPSRYAIVSNGGKVLIDGRSDEEWENRVRRTVREKCAPAPEIKGKFDELVAKEWIIKDRYCDELFYSVIVDRAKLRAGLMDDLTKLLQDDGWNCSLQGRKIYLVPDCVSKGSAVRYVKELAGASYVFAAGDSLLDESMLDVADEFVAPNHGELYRKYGVHDRILFTERSGIRASEEVVGTLMNRMEARNAI
ncbi:HAD family hydrolase [Cohnella cholangitidis]|uniref:Hydrolase n=1 Tax=Cohnella cholangitidis TaxID=2598458 RepID=A0A7G5BWW4_9BACL|nr:hydrolase [Cohnella cholangitidis]QMV41448.1 hydrolase [Cohnella cholangitidis]